MNKPIKPCKPSKYSDPPQKRIEVQKVLLFDTKNRQYILADKKSHPYFFHENDVYLEWDKIDELDFDHNMENLLFSDHQKIYNILKTDFYLKHMRDVDGYYLYTVVCHNIEDPEYEEKLIKYNNRFAEYEKQLAQYNGKMEEYLEYKKLEKKKKLMEELSKL